MKSYWPMHASLGFSKYQYGGPGLKGDTDRTIYCRRNCYSVLKLAELDKNSVLPLLSAFFKMLILLFVCFIER